MIIQEILGTDPISGSRLVKNNNFILLNNEIDLIKTYVKSDTGIIEGISKLTTSQFYITGNKVQITATDFISNNKTTINNNLILTGTLTINNSVSVNHITNPTLVATIGDLSHTPTYYTYKVSNITTTSGDLNISLYSGENGQEIVILYEQNNNGIASNVNILSHASTALYIATGSTKIVLNAVGQSIKLKYIDNGWYVIGGYNYTVSV